MAAAEGLGKPLNHLALTEFQSVDKRFGLDVLKVFELQGAMSRREMAGAPGTKQVRSQLARWRKLLD